MLEIIKLMCLLIFWLIKATVLILVYSIAGVAKLIELMDKKGTKNATTV